MSLPPHQRSLVPSLHTGDATSCQERTEWRQKTSHGEWELARPARNANDVNVPSPKARKGVRKAEEDFSNADYAKGSYVKAKSGDLLKYGRYHLVKFLGRGHFSTVWLCEGKNATIALSLVAIKIARGNSTYLIIARSETQKYYEVTRCAKSTTQLVVYALDSLDETSRNGVHHCIVFPLMVGSIWNAMKQLRYKPFPRPVVRRLTDCMLNGLRFLHDNAGLIHSDF